MGDERRAGLDLSADDEIRRLAILGELLAEKNHEVNNLMMGVLGYAELELSDAPPGTRRPNLEKIVEYARAVQDLSKHLLHFTRTGSGREVGSVNDAVEAVVELYRRAATAWEIQILQELDPAVVGVSLGTGDLRLVLANLLKNAIDALETSTVRTIRVSTKRVGDRVDVEVWNSGEEIPDEVLAHVFAPFFTTKREGRGSGLGLAISRRLVAQAGGDLTASNTRGGVQFRLSVPVADTAAPAVSAGSTAGPAALRGRRVLVVDDEATARDVLGLMVGRIGGAAVDLCASGEEALRLLCQKDFDAVLLDLRMADLSGQDVYRCLSSEMRRRVVFVTGDSVGDATRSFLDATLQPALYKPVDWQDLLGAVQQVAAA